MLPSDMNLKIKTGTVRYDNKILVWKFNLGKNEKVNTGFTKPEEETTTKKELQKTTIIHKVVMQEWSAPQLSRGAQPAEKPIITHEEERAALILFLTGGFTIWFMFR